MLLGRKDRSRDYSRYSIYRRSSTSLPPLLTQLDKLLIYLPLNLKPEERTLGVITIRAQISGALVSCLIHALPSLLLCLVPASPLPSPVYPRFLIVLPAAQFAPNFCMCSFLLPFLVSHSYTFSCHCPTVAEVPHVSLDPSLSSPYTCNQ